MENIDINLNVVGGEQLGNINNEINKMGNESLGRVGGLRKELRALGEAGNVAGGAFAGLGESGRIAFAGLELMEGGLKQIGATLLANPIFLMAAVIAGVVMALEHFDTVSEKTAEDLKKANESAEKFDETLVGLKDDAKLAAISLALAMGEIDQKTADSRKNIVEQGKALADEQKSFDDTSKKHRDQAALDDLESAKKDKQAKIDNDKDYVAIKTQSQLAYEEDTKKHNEAIEVINKTFADKHNEDNKKNDDKSAEDRQKALDDARQVDYQKQLDQVALNIAVQTKGSAEELKAIEDGNNFINDYLDKRNSSELKSLDITLTQRKLIIQENNNKVLEAQQAYRDRDEADDKQRYDEEVKRITDIDDIKIKNTESLYKILASNKVKSIADVNATANAEIDFEWAKYNKLVDLNKATLDDAQNLQDKITAIKKNATEENKRIFVDGVNGELKVLEESFRNMNGPIGDIAATITVSFQKAFDIIEKKGTDTATKVAASLNVIGSALGGIDAYMQQSAQQQENNNQNSLNNHLNSINAAEQKELNVLGLTADQKTAIQNKYGQETYAAELATYNANTILKKNAFEQDKKMKVAQAIISTTAGAIDSYMGMLKIDPTTITSTLVAALVVAAGVAQIAQIESSTFDAGTPPAAFNAASMGTSSSTPLVPTYGLYGGNYLSNGNMQNGGGNGGQGNGNGNGISQFNGGGGQNLIVRAVVIANDVTNSQTMNNYANNMGSL